MDALITSPDMVENLEQCVMIWQTQITIVLQEQQSKQPEVCLFAEGTLIALHKNSQQISGLKGNDL